MESKIKNIFRLGFYIILILISFVLSSCTNDSDDLAVGKMSKAVVNLTFNTEGQGNVTRSLSSSDDSENRVDRIAVLIFDSDGNLIGNIFKEYSTAQTSSFSVSVPCLVSQGCTVCAVANVAETVFTEINTLADFNNLYRTITTPDDLYNSDYMVMFGKETGLSVTSTGISTNISLKRLAAKITFAINTSNDFIVTGYRLCHVPMSSRINDADGSTYNPSTVFGDFTKVKDLSATSVNPVFYMYENLAGTKTGANSFAERNASNAAANASYFVIDTKNTSTNTPYIFTVYLGGDSNHDYTNYSILRNYNYTYTINISGVDTLDVRITEIKPHIGDIYYSDGTWSSTLDESKTPIGIIFSTKTSVTDYSKGYIHGYAMALKDATSNVAWCSSSAGYVSVPLHSLASNSVELEESNCDGFTETNRIRSTSDFSETNYPACYYAVNYITALPSKGTSGWYLPSVGQWYLIVKNLGGVTIAASPAYLLPTDIHYYAAWRDISFSTADAINSYLNKAGSSHVDAIECNTSTIRWYWSSSEFSEIYANILYFDKTGGLGLGYSEKYIPVEVNRVRPVIAF